ncbi:MAG: hypothetical protein IPI67_34120 [Myxococcales bacterium]|nr:hypothetical protein [Myxococcales bacterium]
MGGLSVEVEVLPGPDAAPDAVTKVHELLIETIGLWMPLNLGESGVRVRSEYYPSAVEYATQRGLWGPASDRPGAIEYFFTDFAGLESLGARTMSHWFEIAISLFVEPMEPLLHELGVSLTARPVALDRFVTRAAASPLVELGAFETEIYLLDWPNEGRPDETAEVLVSSESVPRRSLASLPKREREAVERTALLRQCMCRPCGALRRWFWQGVDPWGREYDFGWDEGVSRFEQGDFHGSRGAFLGGFLRGAPFAQEGYGVWIASTLAREGDHDRALTWLRQAVRDGWTKLEELREDPDLAGVRGPALDALIAHGARRRPSKDAGSPSNVLPAWELLGEPELARLARELDARLGRTGAYPDPPPDELAAFLVRLEERGARPPPESLVALCQRVAEQSA